MKHVKEDCARVEVLCPQTDGGCGKSFKRGEAIEHITKVCTNIKLPCPTCKVKMPFKQEHDCLETLLKENQRL